MTARAGALLLLLACAPTPCPAQASASVFPPALAGAPGASLQVEVRADVTATGEDLGSYGAVLTWDPAVLEYSATTAGPAPFDSPVVNASAAATGVLRVADADAVGQPGEVVLFQATFQVVGSPCDLATVSLSMSSLYAAVSLNDLLPLSFVQDAVVSVEDHDYALEALDPVDTVLVWTPLPGAASYDVIRFDPAAVYQDASTVHLGTVLCWEEDSLDATTAAGTEPANPDTGVPAANEAFFYLVRARFGGANLTYGFTGGCTRERLPDGSDCF